MAFAADSGPHRSAQRPARPCAVYADLICSLSRLFHHAAHRLLLLLFLAALPLRTPHAEWLSDEQDIMGTRITVELEHEDTISASRAIQDIMREMRRIDAGMSPYKQDSELSRVNRYAAEHPVVISDELFQLLQRAISFSRLTRGAFDITFASAGFLYDYRAHKKPEAHQLAAAVSRINFHNIRLDGNTSTIDFTRPGVKIDLGGIAKGYAVDNAIAHLQKLGVENALVTAGGDTRVIGERWGRPWYIGIRDPRREEDMVARIPLENVAVSTSGDYERFFEQDGVRYHHIIDPRTGDSARELRSVTIIGPDATTTDALSTSVFVMGLEPGLALINRLADIDAILVDNRGRLHYSNGLQRASTTR